MVILLACLHSVGVFCVWFFWLVVLRQLVFSHFLRERGDLF